MCRAITGGTNIRRKLFKDDSVKMSKLWRCVILNGIGSIVKRPDLLDRSVLIELKRIPDHLRKTDDDIYGRFLELQPRIMGVCFSILAKALSLKDGITVDFELKRLADFTKTGFFIAEALHPGVGNEFLQAYTDNIREINTEIVETNTIIPPLLEVIKKNNFPKEILVSDFHKIALDYIKKNSNAFYLKKFPQTPSLLSRDIKPLIVNIEKEGILIDFKRKTKGQYICISKINDDSQDTLEENIDDDSCVKLPIESSAESIKGTEQDKTEAKVEEADVTATAEDTVEEVVAATTQDTTVEAVRDDAEEDNENAQNIGDFFTEAE
jgi:hypothetical protein